MAFWPALQQGPVSVTKVKKQRRSRGGTAFCPAWWGEERICRGCTHGAPPQGDLCRCPWPTSTALLPPSLHLPRLPTHPTHPTHRHIIKREAQRHQKSCGAVRGGGGDYHVAGRHPTRHQAPASPAPLALRPPWLPHPTGTPLQAHPRVPPPACVRQIDERHEHCPDIHKQRVRADDGQPKQGALVVSPRLHGPARPPLELASLPLPSLHIEPCLLAHCPFARGCFHFNRRRCRRERRRGGGGARVRVCR